MKFLPTSIRSMLLLSIAAAAQAASPDLYPVVGHLPARADGWSRSGAPVRIAVGSSREDVLAIFGEPGARIGEDDWIYWECRVAPLESNPSRYDALVVHFNAQRISSLKVVDRALLRALLESASRASLRPHA